MSEANANTKKVEEEVEDRHLLFNIDDMVYGASLTLVLDIIQVQRITRLPFTPDYVKGIINLRGKVVPVVDARLKLGLPDVEPTDQTCIIVVNIENNHIGLVVDSVTEVVDMKDAKLSTPPNNSSTGSSNKYLNSITEINNYIVLNLDFTRFFSDDIQITNMM